MFLNLVLEYVPETVYRVARHYSKSKQTIPVLYIKVSIGIIQSLCFMANLIQCSFYISSAFNTIQKLSGKGLKMTAYDLNLAYIYLASSKLHVIYY